MKAVAIGLVGLSLCANALAAGRQLTGVYAPAATPALPAAEAEKKFTVPPGFEVRNFAAEPMVVNPVAMTWDERGRLWVVELYEYPLGAKPGEKGRDQVKVLEDTDNDGRADKVTVFADGLSLATGIAIGNGGVYVGQAPHLFFYKDTNGDDVADSKEIAMTGFGLEDRHELLNSFAWGPDGCLYMTHGVFTYSKVKDPNDPADDGVTMTAAVARFHPKDKTFEIFAEGTSNPWGVDFDAAGNAFVSACVIEHLFHTAPAGLYVRQAGNPPYPYAYELLPAINDHKHFRAAYAGIQVYNGNQYPAEHKGTILMGNIHDSSVHQDRLTPNGSTFKASFIRDFVRANDGWFRPVSTQVGPDGAVWIMDWYDKYPCYQNANADPEGVDRAHGRIWRVVYTGDKKGAPIGSRPEKEMNLAKLSNEALVKVLAHPNNWQRRVAQRLLNDRARAGDDLSALGPVLEKAFQTENTDTRMAVLWTAGSLGILTDAQLNNIRRDAHAPVRAWVARFTGERGDVSQAAFERLEALANDRDMSVRLAAATALRQMTSGSLTVNTKPRQEPPVQGIAMVGTALLMGRGNGDDPVLPFVMWMALEPMFMKDITGLLNWLAKNDGADPVLRAKLAYKMMRRICDVQEPKYSNMALNFLKLAPTNAFALQRSALDGIIDGNRGKVVVPLGTFGGILAQLAGSPDAEVANRAQRLGAIWGDEAAVAGALKVLQDSSAPAERRIQGIQAVKQGKAQTVRTAMLALVGDKNERVRIEAIRALGEMGVEAAPAAIVREWKDLPAPAQRAAAEVLTARKEWLPTFFAAIEKKTINPIDIPTPVIRALTASKDETIRVRAAAAIGRVREADADKAKLIAAKKQIVLAGPADLKAGHEMAKKTCLTCHKLHGEGADVGPDLTGVGRSSLEALLANVIDPNQLIGLGYENIEVETKDGRTVAGRMVEDTDAHIKLLSAGPKEEVIAKSNMASKRISELSVMPEGLEQMADADFRNMIWYILNPPQDKKAVELELAEKRLIVKARTAERELPFDLVSYVIDPAVRPYLHPVKDPSGKITLTQDRPSDHIWQHGIFTGLHKVNGMDFWTEQQGKQRFVRLTDIIQEQDRAGWRAMAEWFTPEGKILLEEEQAVTVHAVNGDSYMIDFDWTLRSKGDLVKMGRHDYGGFSVRPDHAGPHQHLNSDGKRDKDVANQRAAWANTSRAYGDKVYGITIMDHPSNYGHPSFWRIDDFGFLNPSPSLQTDWSVEAGGSRTFRYRVLIHPGAGDKEAIDRAFHEFAQLKFAGR